MVSAAGSGGISGLGACRGACRMRRTVLTVIQIRTKNSVSAGKSSIVRNPIAFS